LLPAPTSYQLYCNQTQTRTHHLSASDMEVIIDIGMAQAKHLIGANVFYVRSSQVISRLQVQYLSGFHSKVQIIIFWMKSSVMLTNLSVAGKSVAFSSK